MGWEKPKSKWKWGFPCHLVMFDDLVGRNVFNANCGGIANRFLISHRHYSASILILIWDC